MIEFKCGEDSSFEFEMQISGDLSGAPSVCFCIMLPSFTMSVPAIEKGTGVWCVNVPALDKYVSCGEYSCHLRVDLGDRFFVPMSDVVCLREVPKPVVSNFNVTSKAAAPSITIKPVSVQTVAAPMTQPDVAPVPPAAVNVESKTEPVEEQIQEKIVDPKDQKLFDAILKKKK